MEVYRTDVSLNPEDLYGQFKGIMHGLNIWHHDDLDGATAKFYINSTQYIQTFYESYAFGINIYDGAGLAPYGDNVVRTSNMSNASIYVNSDAVAMCFVTQSPTSYSHAALIIIDKIGEDMSIIYRINANNRVVVLNSFTNGLELYAPYNSSYSLANHSDVAQIAPYIDIVRGNTYESLHGVLVAPWMNTIIDKSGEKWLFTNGFAIPCGTEINYHYYE